ncbi:hypothetical protein [Glaciecola sp. 1036]|uniref:hypothetical protein n=1 Tax=Alteromonadaceae TaxID=72275 RepID=UPI003CFE75D9
MTFDIALLNHEQVPPELSLVNRALQANLENDIQDIDEISKLTQERAILVENLLTSLQEQPKTPNFDVKAFIQAELSINQQLLKFVDDLKKGVQQEILGLSKGKKAIGHYTGKHAKLHKTTSP